MKTSTGTRELITIDIGGTRIRGTYHKPRDHGPASPLHVRQQERIGVLFLNPGTVPRAALGDSAVYWAKSFAARGYSAFRFDLPGLGDSEGDLPARVLDFQASVNHGDYAKVVSAIAQYLVERFKLAGVVAVGLCGAAVTAVYAAAADKRIAGLILMDPYFNLQREVPTQRVAHRWYARIMRSLEEDWDRAKPSGRGATGMSLFFKLRDLYRAIKHLPLPGRTTRLPNNANLPLIRCWKEVAGSGRPILVLGSPSSVPKEGAFDYFAYLQSLLGDRSKVVSELIGGTNHSFEEGAGKDAVRRYSQQWLSDNFPLVHEEARFTSRAEVAEFSSRDATLVATH